MLQNMLANLRRQADSLEFFTLLVLVLAGMASERLLPLAAAAGTIFCLARLAARRRIELFWPIDGPIIFLILMTGLSLVWVSALPEMSLPQALRLVNGAWLFYATVRWGGRSFKRARWLAVGLVSTGLGLAGIALFTVDWSTKFRFIPESLLKMITPLQSDTIQPNVMAGALVLVLAGLVAGLVFGWRMLHRWQKWVLVLAGLFMAGILVLTQSRGGLMGLGAAFLLILALRFKRGWVAIPVCLALATGLVLAVGPDRLFDSLSHAQTGISSLEGRVEIWSRAVSMIGDFPVTGIGIGTFGPVADTLYPFNYNVPGSIPHAHNLFLQIAVDLGLPGLIAWLSLWGFIILSAARMFRAGRRTHVHWQMAAAAAVLCSQAAMAIHGLSDAVTWDTRPAVLVWVIWGFAIAACKQADSAQITSLNDRE